MPRETVWKVPTSVMVAYAPHYGEQEIPYRSLSDDEWRCISPHLPGPIAQGRPRIHGLRAILDAVFYILKSGCPWRMLPKDLERLGRPSRTGSQAVAHRRYVGTP